MSNDHTYITGKVQTAEDIVGIPGVVEFRGKDSRGIFHYNPKLNQLAELESVTLLDPPPEEDSYDYVVANSGGLLVRANWVGGGAGIQPTVDWSKVPEGTEVEVSNDENTWYKMHFASYDPDDPMDKPYYVFGSGRSAFTAQDQWMEEISVKVPDGASAVANDEYFLLYSNEDAYYIWFNVDDNGTDPAIPDATGVEVELPESYDAADVATAIQEAVDALSDFSATVGTTTVNITVQTAGKTYDAAKGTTDLHITVTKQGGDTVNYSYARLA